MRIFLTGFMASGKSTAGGVLASLLGLPFRDLDQVIELRTGLSVSEFFSRYGEQKFREEEEAALLDVLAGPADEVVALGGGTLCFGDNLSRVLNSGICIYLKHDVSTLVSRLVEVRGSRPLLGKVPENDWKAEVCRLLALREPYYEKAHLIVEAVGMDPQGIAENIRIRLKTLLPGRV